MNMTLLHLSDLQFGRHHADLSSGRPQLYTKGQYNLETNKFISDLKILGKESIKPDYLVISADIAETSLEEEYDLAEKFLNRIIEFLNIDKRSVILVPGDHDINLDLCKAARFTASAYKKEFIPPYFEKFGMFCSFYDNFYRDVKWANNKQRYSFDRENLFVIYPFINQRVLFIGLNSCVDECDKEPHYGNITVEQ